MRKLTIGVLESRFADYIWANAPIRSRDLVKYGEEAFNWKRTTTYTVLKRLCDRGLFVTENAVVSTLMSRDEFYAIQSEQFVESSFKGSLPDFFAAFATRKKPTAEEIETLHRMIDAWGGSADE
ncbi:MAG: BlaI/MecI/CopY family transcriptional regulator [Clostridia bacterium]|nr:BlaI/MecI/CopY family transcriptional regulator [Clostridia bacterium]